MKHTSATLFSALAAFTAVAHAATGDYVVDPNLHRSFYGIAYSPDGVILPDCTATQEKVNQDIFKLAQLTPRIRLYGSDCNQTALVLQAIQDTGVDLSVYPAIYIPAPLNQTVVDRQTDAVLDAIATYGTKNVLGITVGNEFLLNSYGSGSPTDAVGVAARDQLLAAAATFNSSLLARNFDKQFPVGTSDAGSAATVPLCEGMDYFMANVHPWFGSVPIDDAAGWTWQFEQDFDTDVCNQASNKPQVFVAETGWPTASDNSSSATNGASEASVANLQKYLDTYVCQSNKNETQYFFFEFKDEPWKAIYGGVEQHWGLFDDDLNLKDVTIPNCPVDSPTGKSAPTSSSTGTNNKPATTGTKTASSGTSTSTSSSADAVRVPSIFTFISCVVVICMYSLA